MDAKTTIKAWKWLTAALAVLNVALCISVWYRPQNSMQVRPEKLDEFIIGKLHFSDKQVLLFDELKNRHHDSVVALQDAGRKMRKTLFDNLKGAARTEMQMDSLMSAVGENQKQIEFVTYRHFRQLREICDEGQKKIFDDIIEDILKKMGGRRPGGPPPRGENGPPGDGNGPPPGPPPNEAPPHP